MAFIHEVKHYDPVNSIPAIDRFIGGSTVSVFFNSCSKRCPGCFNMQTWGRKKSLFVPNEVLAEEILTALDKFFPKSLALLGGDPLEATFQQDFRNNATDTLEILEIVKQARPQTQVICWTGYTWEEALEIPIINEILRKGLIDILVDGKFVEELKVEHKLYGSSNQTVIDVAKSLDSGSKVVLEL